MQQQTGRDEAQPLTVAHLRVVHRVRLRHLVQILLARAAIFLEKLVRRKRPINVPLDHRLAARLLRNQHPVRVEHFRPILHARQPLPDRGTQRLRNAHPHQGGQIFGPLFRPLLIPLHDDALPLVQLGGGTVLRHLARTAQQRFVPVRAVVGRAGVVKVLHRLHAGRVAEGPVFEVKVQRQGRRGGRCLRLHDLVRMIDRIHLPRALAVFAQRQVEVQQQRPLVAEHVRHDAQLALGQDRDARLDHEPHRLLDALDD